MRLDGNAEPEAMIRDLRANIVVILDKIHDISHFHTINNVYLPRISFRLLLVSINIDCGGL